MNNHDSDTLTGGIWELGDVYAENLRQALISRENLIDAARWERLTETCDFLIGRKAVPSYLNRMRTTTDYQAIAQVTDATAMVSARPALSKLLEEELEKVDDYLASQESRRIEVSQPIGDGETA